jgi:hypothetical protein
MALMGGLYHNNAKPGKDCFRKERKSSDLTLFGG